MTDTDNLVIVRCTSAGVWAGIMADRNGDEVELLDARRLWRWQAHEGISLSAVALHGIKEPSRVPAAVSRVTLLGACEIIECSPAAAVSIREYPEAEAQAS